MVIRPAISSKVPAADSQLNRKVIKACGTPLALARSSPGHLNSLVTASIPVPLSPILAGALPLIAPIWAMAKTVMSR